MLHIVYTSIVLHCTEQAYGITMSGQLRTSAVLLAAVEKSQAGSTAAKIAPSQGRASGIRCRELFIACFWPYYGEYPNLGLSENGVIHVN